MTDPKGLCRQRSPDHVSRVASPTQSVGADQHVRRSATGTPRPTRSSPHLAVAPSQHPPARGPPRPQPATTIRTHQLTRHQRALDFQRVSSYDLQQCLRAPGRALPSRPSEKAGGSLRVQDACTLTPDANKHNPKAAPNPSPPSTSLQQPPVFNQRGAQHRSAILPSLSGGAVIGRSAAALRACARRPWGGGQRAPKSATSAPAFVQWNRARDRRGHYGRVRRR